MGNWLVVSLAGLACVATTILLGVPGWLFARYLRYRSRATGDAGARDDLRKLAAQRGWRELKGGVHEGREPLRQGGTVRVVRAEVVEVTVDRDTRLMLRLGTPVPTDRLAIRHRGLVQPVAEPGTPTGDAAFDMRFHVDAAVPWWSMLVAPVRTAMLHAAEDAAVRIEGGWLWVEVPGTVAEFAISAERLARLDEVAVAFERLPPSLDARAVDARIRTLVEDDVAKVRLHTLERVAAAGSDFARYAAQLLLADPDVHVRSRAAELSGEPGRMLELARDPTVPAALRARLGRALASGGRVADRHEVARALTTRHGAAPPDPALVDVALELLRPLGADAEPLLIEVVHTAPDWIVRRVVAQLGETGSARSMVVLQALATSARPDIVRSEAKVALALLRSRSNRSRSAAHQVAVASDGEMTRTTPLNAVQPGTARALSTHPPRRGPPRKPTAR